jgi:hypothetical protein
LIPDIKIFLPVAIFKMTATIPHKINILFDFNEISYVGRLWFPLFPLYLDFFPFSVLYISKMAIISKVTRYDYNLTIMKWSLPNQIMCFLLPVDSKPIADKISVNNQKLPLKSINVEFLRYCGGHFENGDREKFFDVRNQFRTL